MTQVQMITDYSDHRWSEFTRYSSNLVNYSLVTRSHQPLSLILYLCDSKVFSYQSHFEEKILKNQSYFVTIKQSYYKEISLANFFFEFLAVWSRKKRK